MEHLTEQCAIGGSCTFVKLLEQRVESQEAKMAKLEDIIDTLRNRLPLWATMAFAAGGAIIGFLANKVI